MNFTKYTAALALFATAAFAAVEDNKADAAPVKTEAKTAEVAAPAAAPAAEPAAAPAAEPVKVEKSAAADHLASINECIAETVGKEDKEFTECLKGKKLPEEFVKILTDKRPTAALDGKTLIAIIPAAAADAPVAWYRTTSFMVGAGAVALIALGAGGYFMFAKKDAEEL